MSITKSHKLLFSTILFLVFILFGIINSVSAQSCSGTLTCCSSQTCNVGLGEPCNGTCNGTSSCPWTYSLCDNSIQCSLNTTPSCNNQASCSAIGKNIVVGGSCVLTNPPTITPSPTNVPTPPAGSQTCYNCNPGWCQAETIPDTSTCPAPNNCDACSGPTPTPPPGTCSGITYSFNPSAVKYSANTGITVNIDRTAGGSCSGNWDNVNLEFDGVNQGIAITGPTTYSSSVNVGSSGTHSVRLTVNNGTCDCNATSIYTMPQGTFTSATCTAGQPYNDLSYTLTADIVPGTCSTFDRVRYWIQLTEDNFNDVPLINALGPATWVGNYGGGVGLEHLYQIIQINPPASSPLTTIWDQNDLIGSSGWTIDDLSQWTVDNGQEGRTFSVGGNLMCNNVQNDWIGSKNIKIQPDACVAAPSCSALTPTYGDFELLPGQSLERPVTADTTPPNSATTVEYSTANTSVAYFHNPADGNLPPAISNPFIDTPGFQGDIFGSGNIGDSTIYTIDAYAGTTVMCSQTGTVTITNPPAWWQAAKSSVVAAGGGITSSIPYPSCYLDASCDPNLITYASASNEYPGVAMASGGSTSISAGSTGGTISDPYNWKATSMIYSNMDDYSYTLFESKVPDSYFGAGTDPGGTVTSSLASGGYLDANGYRWYRHNGPLTIQSAQALANSKVVLFVDGNVTIENTINFTDGVGFFMVISSGNITVLDTVGGDIASYNKTTPELEGIYYADGTFATGSFGEFADTKALHVRGSVFAGNVSLDRSLTDNSTVPGEYFEYGADALMNYPRELRIRRIRWREIAP